MNAQPAVSRAIPAPDFPSRQAIAGRALAQTNRSGRRLERHVQRLQKLATPAAVCALPTCGVFMSGRRSDARYCPEHRKAGYRLSISGDNQETSTPKRSSAITSSETGLLPPTFGHGRAGKNSLIGDNPPTRHSPRIVLSGLLLAAAPVWEKIPAALTRTLYYADKMPMRATTPPPVPIADNPPTGPACRRPLSRCYGSHYQVAA